MKSNLPPAVSDLSIKILEIPLEQFQYMFRIVHLITDMYEQTKNGPRLGNKIGNSQWIHVVKHSSAYFTNMTQGHPLA